VFRRKPRIAVLPPEWLIVGLGNPGPEYAGTRHNVGFATVDLLAQRHGFRLKSARFRALFGEGAIAGIPAVLAKPLTYMNLSGNAVSSLARHYSIPPNRILVVADELDLPVGRIRLRERGGTAGHNGHKSVASALGTDTYPRVRIGIGAEGRGEAADHVLSRFGPDERAIADQSIQDAADACEWVLSEGMEAAMNRANRVAKDGD
jgi:PTH1 family peptidyl-tRNA hydrolase